MKTASKVKAIHFSFPALFQIIHLFKMIIIMQTWIYNVYKDYM